MDDLRDSLSRLKKGFKYQFARGKRDVDKPGGNRSNVDNESVEPSVEPSATGDGNGSDWGSIVSSTAKLLLRGVRDSADAFPQLKSVAGGLCFILENCEVRSPPPSAIHNAYRCPRE